MHESIRNSVKSSFTIAEHTWSFNDQQLVDIFSVGPAMPVWQNRAIVSMLQNPCSEMRRQRSHRDALSVRNRWAAQRETLGPQTSVVARHVDIACSSSARHYIRPEYWRRPGQQHQFINTIGTESEVSSYKMLMDLQYGVGVDGVSD